MNSRHKFHIWIHVMESYMNAWTSTWSIVKAYVRIHYSYTEIYVWIHANFMPASNSEFIHEFFSMNSKTNSDHEEYQPSLWQCYCPLSPPLRLQRFCCRGWENLRQLSYCQAAMIAAMFPEIWNNQQVLLSIRKVSQQSQLEHTEWR